MEKKRKGYNLLDKTLIIIKNLDQLKYHDKRNIVNEYMEKNPIKNRVIGKDTPLFFILTWNRYGMVNDVINMNPFNTKKCLDG